jgi:hypothetical protein
MARMAVDTGESGATKGHGRITRREESRHRRNFDVCERR